MTKSQEVANDVAALIRARNPLIWIVTREEARVERYLIEAATSAAYKTSVWDVAQGVVDPLAVNPPSQPIAQEVSEVLGMIRAASEARTNRERRVWILRDLPEWIAGFPGASPKRMLRNLARSLPGSNREAAQAVVVLTPANDVPSELAGHATVIEWPLPDREEIAATLDAIIETVPEFEDEEKTKPFRSLVAPNGTREAAIDAAVGLSQQEAQACYAKSLVQLRRIDPLLVAKEKKRVIARERVLEWIDPLPGGLDAVGGLEVLKSWLLARKAAYTPAARAYGLPAPKGALLVGIPGTGKSLSAKAVATAWGVPLLRLDMGALKGKFVGESEGNIRKAFRTIEAVGRCVVWIDEIEKAMAGATQGAADGGVSADALGSLLSWMQDRAGPAFVFATANDVSALPPELLRKGRFDELFFVDLPTSLERCAILQAALASNGRADHRIDVLTVSQKCEGFTGAEIAAIIPDAMFAAFADGGREISTRDLVQAASLVVPLAKTAEEKIANLRKWATGRARSASAAVAEANAPKKEERVLDL